MEVSRAVVGLPDDERSSSAGSTGHVSSQACLSASHVLAMPSSRPWQRVLPWPRLPQGTLRHWEASHIPSGLFGAVGTLLAPRHLPPQRVPPADLEESPLLCLRVSLAFGDRVVQSHVTGPVAPLEAAPTDGGVSVSPSPAGATLGVCPHPASALAPRAPAGLELQGHPHVTCHLRSSLCQACAPGRPRPP